MFPGTLSTRLRERGCICVCYIAIGSGRLLRPDVFGLGPARVHVFVKAKPGESPLSQLALWAKSGESSSQAAPLAVCSVVLIHRITVSKRGGARSRRPSQLRGRSRMELEMSSRSA